MKTQIIDKHHPAPTRRGHVYYRWILFSEKFCMRPDSPAVLTGQRADLQWATHDLRPQRGARAVWLIFEKKISNEVRLIKASGGVTARWLKITKVIVFSQKYCAKGVIFSLVWKRALGKKMKRIQWTRDKLILVLELYLSNSKTLSKIPEDILAK